VAAGTSLLVSSNGIRYPKRATETQLPPPDSHANPPGVPTQLTDIPKFEVVVVPACWGPQGIPRAGRVSRLAAGGAGGREGGLIVVDGDGAFVSGVTVAGDHDGALLGSGIGVSGVGALLGSGMAVSGVGAVMAGGGVAFVGAGATGGIAVNEDGFSTVAGVSGNSGVERRAMMIKNPTSATIMTLRTSAAVFSRRRRRVATGLSSVAAPANAGSEDITASPMRAAEGIPGRTKALSAAATDGVGTTGWVMATVSESVSVSRGVAEAGRVMATVSVSVSRGVAEASGDPGSGGGAGMVVAAVSRWLNCLF
jgi:hypothetical protein